jgi:hypothetical protein
MSHMMVRGATALRGVGGGARGSMRATGSPGIARVHLARRLLASRRRAPARLARALTRSAVSPCARARAVAAAQQPSIILLREGTDTSQGKAQLISNINAIAAVVDILRTTLGPRGMDKLIHRCAPERRARVAGEERTSGGGRRGRREARRTGLQQPVRPALAAARPAPRAWSRRARCLAGARARSAPPPPRPLSALPIALASFLTHTRPWSLACPRTSPPPPCPPRAATVT